MPLIPLKPAAEASLLETAAIAIYCNDRMIVGDNVDDEIEIAIDRAERLLTRLNEVQKKYPARVLPSTTAK